MAKIVTYECDICQTEIPAGFPARPNWACLSGQGELPLYCMDKGNLPTRPNILKYGLFKGRQEVEEPDICHKCLLDMLNTAPAYLKLKVKEGKK